jgi:hypothetical protein
MGYRPITMYVVACDSRGCDHVARFYDCEMDKRVELLLDQPQMTADTRRELTEQGWIVSGRMLCPADAKAATETAVERLEIELTHNALFDMQQQDALDQAEGGAS